MPGGSVTSSAESALARPKPPTAVDVTYGKPSFDCASVDRCVVASLVTDRKSFALWQLALENSTAWMH